MTHCISRNCYTLLKQNYRYQISSKLKTSLRYTYAIQFRGVFNRARANEHSTARERKAKVYKSNQ
jgi:hypothetical protein